MVKNKKDFTLPKKKSKLSTIPPAPKGENRGDTTKQPVLRGPAMSKAVSRDSRVNVPKGRRG